MSSPPEEMCLYIGASEIEEALARFVRRPVHEIIVSDSDTEADSEPRAPSEHGSVEEPNTTTLGDGTNAAIDNLASGIAGPQLQPILVLRPEGATTRQEEASRHTNAPASTSQEQEQASTRHEASSSVKLNDAMKRAEEPSVNNPNQDGASTQRGGSFDLQEEVTVFHVPPPPSEASTLAYDDIPVLLLNNSSNGPPPGQQSAPRQQQEQQQAVPFDPSNTVTVHMNMINSINSVLGQINDALAQIRNEMLDELHPQARAILDRLEMPVRDFRLATHELQGNGEVDPMGLIHANLVLIRRLVVNLRDGTYAFGV
ncbi:hypothetical protein OQA88_10129 [Cercophora sp. LCS_1]